MSNNNREQEVQLNLDQEGIDDAIKFLQKMKTLHQSTRMSMCGAHGVNSSINQAIAKLGDAEILYNHYINGE